jgi:Big-like domain-containing protein
VTRLDRFFFLCCWACLGLACSRATAPTTAPRITQVGAPSTGLTATVGSPITIAVQVADGRGNPLSGVGVTWNPVLNAGHLSSATSTTDAQGNASVQWTLDTLAGTNTISATAPGASPLTINATGTSGAASHFLKVSGDSQSVAINSIVPAPLVVGVTDRYGNPVVTLPNISWDGGTCSYSANGGSVGDSLGHWKLMVTMGGTRGTCTIDASTTAVPNTTIVFTLTGL